jgi:hypothetical protein
MRRTMSALEPLEGHYSRKAIRRSALPDADEQQALRDRQQELAAALTPADPDEVQRSVAALVANLPAPPGTEASVRLQVSARTSVLTQFPIWAVNEVCRKYMDGSLSSGGYMPSAPEMANACRAAVGRFHEELHRLDGILNAEVYDDPTPESIGRATGCEEAIRIAAESRSAAVKRHWEDRRHEFVTEGEVKARPETPDEIMARLEREKGQPLVVGESLRRAIDERNKA